MVQKAHLVLVWSLVPAHDVVKINSMQRSLSSIQEPGDTSIVSQSAAAIYQQLIIGCPHVRAKKEPLRLRSAPLAPSSVARLLPEIK